MPTKQHLDRTRGFPYAGITVFILFFGTSLIDAIGGAHWTNVLFWTLMGLGFLALDKAQQPRSKEA